MSATQGRLGRHVQQLAQLVEEQAIEVDDQIGTEPAAPSPQSDRADQ